MLNTILFVRHLKFILMLLIFQKGAGQGERSQHDKITRQLLISPKTLMPIYILTSSYSILTNVQTILSDEL